jgi:pyruvate-formate lyase
MTVRRAKALANVLASMPLHLNPGDHLAGSMQLLIDSPLPDGTTLPDYESAVREVEQIGERSFHTNSDHMAPDYAGLVEEGIGGLIARATTERDHERPDDEIAFLDSVIIALEGVERYLIRYADYIAQTARQTDNDSERDRLSALSRVVRNVSTAAPTTFHEAAQLTWTFHFIYSLEGRGAMALGRMDQFLRVCYDRDITSGRITRGDAGAILESFWAKLEEPGIPNPIQNIAIGGLTPDGRDATNDLSYLIIEVTKRMKTPASNLSARTHRDTPEEFYLACADLIRSGIGFPAMFNDETLIPALIKIGIPLENARDVCFVGCIETFLPGRMPPWSDSRVNILKAVELALHDGVDPLTGNRAGPATGSLDELGDFTSLMEAFRAQLAAMVSEHARGINESKDVGDPREFTSPLLSALARDCITRGRDMNDGGAEFPDFHGMAGMGLATATDSLMALKRLVYDEKRFDLTNIMAAVERDFDGDEVLRQVLLNDAPKYGNGEEEADLLAADISEEFCRLCHLQKTPASGCKPAGQHVPLLAANTSNIPAGKEVGATPDGRHALTPLSDAASPHFGRDHKGPTAVIRSLTQVDYSNVSGGTVVNMRFQGSTLEGETGLRNLAALIRTYFAMGGGQMQFNVTDRALLEDARKHPDRHGNLLVRVSGFSAVFVGLGDEVQLDILARTEQDFVS